MTPIQAKELRAAVRKLVRAEIADSWKGGGYPEDMPLIAADLIVARLQFDNILHSLTTDCEPPRKYYEQAAK